MLVRIKAVPKVIGNWYSMLIIIKNLVNPVFSLFTICVVRLRIVMGYFSFEKQIGKQIILLVKIILKKMKINLLIETNSLY